MSTETFLQHLRDEAEYGLEHSHQNSLVSRNNCNARRQLRLIISAIDQFNGIIDEARIGWAQDAGREAHRE